MNEAETRVEHIYPALHGAGRGAAEGGRVLRGHCLAPGRLQGGGGEGAWARAEDEAIRGTDRVTGAEDEAAHYSSPDDLWNLNQAQPSPWRDRNFGKFRKHFSDHEWDGKSLMPPGPAPRPLQTRTDAAVLLATQPLPPPSMTSTLRECHDDRHAITPF